MSTRIDVLHWFSDPVHWSGPEGIPIRLAQHVQLSAESVALGALFALPVGVVLGHYGRFGNLAINISNQESKALDRFINDRFDYVITVCDEANESCPVFAGARERLHWSFPDPAQGTGTEEEQLGVYRSVRDALRKVFEPWGMTPFIVDDAVLLTSEEVGAQKQLKQRIDVDVDDVPLATAVKQLARRKAINLVVDQKVTKQAEKKVSLQVEDVAMETAVRLLAEQAGLKAARIDNVLYVTSPEQAASIAAENRANTVPAYPPGMYGPYWPLAPPSAWPGAAAPSGRGRVNISRHFAGAARWRSAQSGNRVIGACQQPMILARQRPPDQRATSIVGTTPSTGHLPPRSPASPSPADPVHQPACGAPCHSELLARPVPRTRQGRRQPASAAPEGPRRGPSRGEPRRRLLL